MNQGSGNKSKTLETTFKKEEEEEEMNQEPTLNDSGLQVYIGFSSELPGS